MENLNMTLEFLTVSGAFIIDHLEGVAGSISVAFACYFFHKGNKDKELEIYMNLYQQWDTLWAKITAYPVKNKDLFKKDIRELTEKDEDLKLAIFQSVTLMSRVHYYYEKTGQKIQNSDWQKEAEYMMSKNVFVTAYQKHVHRYNDRFNAYMKGILIAKKSQSQNVVDVHVKKEHSLEIVSKSNVKKIEHK